MRKLLPQAIVAPKFINKIVDRSEILNGLPFSPDTETHTPQGKFTCVHYGVMIANLPAPFNFLNLLTVVGQPKVRIFRNEHLIKTTDIDTANVLIGTAVGTKDHFNGYSVKNDCALVSNGSSLRFGNDLLLEGKYPNFYAKREGHDFNFELNIRATDKIAKFALMSFDIYNHWALLCEYDGYLEYKGEKTEVKGLCTYEYARGVDVDLHMKYFTYHILNIDEKTQVLLVEVIGPLNLVLQRRVYVRALDDHGAVYTKDFKFHVSAFGPERVTTPNGISMRLPQTFNWSVNDDYGQTLISIEGIANGDFKYGMTGGYAGSYEYKGMFKGKSINGTGYIEYIDTRE